MPKTLWWLVGALAAWTAYLWITRLVNAWSSTDETTSAKAVSTAISVVFLGFVALALVILVRTWSEPLEAWMRGALLAFAGWTVVVWLVRIVSISLADHTAAFKVVHAALGVVSIVLAVAVTWGVVADRDAASQGASSDPSISTDGADAL